MNEPKDTMQRQLVETAMSLIAGEIDLVRGCRKLTTLSQRLDPEEKLFLPIVAFDSETDDYPLNEIRKSYQKSYLEKLDRDLFLYEEKMRSTILSTCQLIVSKYG